MKISKSFDLVRLRDTCTGLYDHKVQRKKIAVWCFIICTILFLRNACNLSNYILKRQNWMLLGIVFFMNLYILFFILLICISTNNTLSVQKNRYILCPQPRILLFLKRSLYCNLLYYTVWLNLLVCITNAKMLFIVMSIMCFNEHYWNWKVK